MIPLCFQCYSNPPLSASRLHRNYKRWLEYLFYVHDPEHAVENEFVRVPEEGFKSADEYKVLGRAGK